MRNDEEARNQEAFFQWATMMQMHGMPELDLMYAIPNEGSRSVVDGARRKKRGRKAGVPDVHLPLPRLGYNGLWIEFKSSKGKVSESQKEWHAKLIANGHRVEVTRDWKHATEIVTEYLSS